MPNPITGVNKFRYVLVLQGNYGAWEDICEYADRLRDRADARDDIRAHRANEPGYAFRIITRRELEPEYNFTPANYLLRARNLRSMANIAQRCGRPETAAERAAQLRRHAKEAIRKGKLLRDAAGR